MLYVWLNASRVVQLSVRFYEPLDGVLSALARHLVAMNYACDLQLAAK